MYPQLKITVSSNGVEFVSASADSPEIKEASLRLYKRFD